MLPSAEAAAEAKAVEAAAAAEATNQRDDVFVPQGGVKKVATRDEAGMQRRSSGGDGDLRKAGSS
jgi:hypothetical protein